MIYTLREMYEQGQQKQPRMSKRSIHSKNTLAAKLNDHGIPPKKQVCHTGATYLMPTLHHLLNHP